MLCARGENVLFMDADGATRVSEVERLEAKLKELTAGTTGALRDAMSTANGHAIATAASGAVEKLATATVGADRSTLGFVLGSRAHLQDAAMAQRTWVRNVLMHGFHALVTLVVGRAIRDTQCGFKVGQAMVVGLLGRQRRALCASLGDGFAAFVC